MTGRRALALGTAGHVDHGKTALVLALTGRDTDRLPAEKARGISIALGFAPLALPEGRTVSLIDVPGHERFVRHMVAGASGVDGFLLCVAADDGVMPQTREHLAVLGLLGVRDGVVAVTRADLADPAAAAAAVRPLVAPATEVIPVCAPTGAGIPELRAALGRLATRLVPRRATGPARLFVDRVFAIAGAGTVVTGTHWGAPVAPGDRVTVLPSGAAGRVRSVQAHDRPADRADGGRVALALAGVPRDAAPRGSCVCAPTTTGGAPPTGWARACAGSRTRAATWPTGAACSSSSAPPRSRPRACRSTRRACRPAPRAWWRCAWSGRCRPGPATGWCCAPAAGRWAAGWSSTRSPRAAPAGPTGPQRLRTLADGTPGERDALRLRDAGRDGLDPAALETGRGVVLGGRAFDPAVVEEARAAVRAAAAPGAPTPAAARAASGLPPRAAAALVDGLVAEDALTLRGDGDLEPALEALARLLEDAGLHPPTPASSARTPGWRRRSCEPPSAVCAPPAGRRRPATAGSRPRPSTGRPRVPARRWPSVPWASRSCATCGAWAAAGRSPSPPTWTNAGSRSAGTTCVSCAAGSGRGLVARLVFKTSGGGWTPPGRFDSYAAPPHPGRQALSLQTRLSPGARNAVNAAPMGTPVGTPARALGTVQQPPIAAIGAKPATQAQRQGASIRRVGSEGTVASAGASPDLDDAIPLMLRIAHGATAPLPVRPRE